jgi:hypothetical protein
MAVNEAVNPQHIVDTIVNNHIILWLSSYDKPIFFVQYLWTICVK